MNPVAASSVEEIQQAIRELPAVRVVGAGTKPSLSHHANLCVRGLTGMLEYVPGEYTFTARAGTTLREVAETLGRQRQFLPFDPPLAEAGATLGGTVAAGLSGSGRFRYGGLRDFLLGIRFVDGAGHLRAGGGKVVKNAAGFDIPKLMVGALGRLGVLAELTFKVFPAPQRYATVRKPCATPLCALSDLSRLARQPLDLMCLDLEPPQTVCIRIGGLGDALEPRLKRLEDDLAGDALTVLRGEDDAALWREVSEMAWAPADAALVKVPTTPTQIESLETAFASAGVDTPRRYCAGGNLLWLSWPADRLADLSRSLEELGATGLLLRGPGEDVYLGSRHVGEFERRLAAVFDPNGRFGTREGERIGP